jgi:hypothetical protein
MVQKKFAGPVAIGGVGGSGTRVLAHALQAVGVNIGTDLNEPLDNLLFTLLFKDRRILALDDETFAKRCEIFASAVSGASNTLSIPDDVIDGDRPGSGLVQHDTGWLNERKARLAERLFSGEEADSNIPWGWKEPNTHVVLDRLADNIPELKYVHLVRNGLDMAFSDNQNQLRFWGRYFLTNDQTDPDVTPTNSLSYWVRAEKRVREIGERMGSSFLLIRFEDLCADPETELSKLFAFCGISIDPAMMISLGANVQAPASVNRGRHADKAQMDAADLAWLAACGYSL